MSGGWDGFWHQISLLGSAGLAMVLAFIGDVVRLMHLQEQGQIKLTWRVLPGAMLRSALMGVIATATAIYLRDTYGFPELVGAALGGILGYLGPSALSMGFASLLARYVNPSKPKDEKDA